LGVFALSAAAPHVLAQDDPAPEIITEPPPQTKPPPQPTKAKEPPGHLRVGGGIGFGIGTDFISLGISPQVSYIFKRIVEPGVAFSYQYAKDRVPIPEVIWHTYGGSLFVRDARTTAICCSGAAS